jgi:hypothetical protein
MTKRSYLDELRIQKNLMDIYEREQRLAAKETNDKFGWGYPEDDPDFIAEVYDRVEVEIIDQLDTNTNSSD